MLVIDSNAAINIVLGTQDGNALRQLILDGESVIAPDLYVSENTSAFSKYVRDAYLSAHDAQDLLLASLELVDEYVESATLCLEALKESTRLGHSSYDLLYLILARRSGATLLTLDSKLQRLCIENGVNCVFTDKEF